MCIVIVTSKKERIAVYVSTDMHVVVAINWCNQKSVRIIVCKKVTILTMQFKNVGLFGFIIKCINHADML